jgi:hypothetical protein
MNGLIQKKPGASALAARGSFSPSSTFKQASNWKLGTPPHPASAIPSSQLGGKPKPFGGGAKPGMMQPTGSAMSGGARPASPAAGRGGFGAVGGHPMGGARAGMGGFGNPGAGGGAPGFGGMGHGRHGLGGLGGMGGFAGHGGMRGGFGGFGGMRGGFGGGGLRGIAEWMADKKAKFDEWRATPEGTQFFERMQERWGQRPGAPGAGQPPAPGTPPAMPAPGAPPTTPNQPQGHGRNPWWRR